MKMRLVFYVVVGPIKVKEIKEYKVRGTKATSVEYFDAFVKRRIFRRFYKTLVSKRNKSFIIVKEYKATND